MSLSTQGLTSFVLLICSPLGGLSRARGPLPEHATGRRTPVWLEAGPGGPGVAGGEQRAARASWLPAHVHGRMSDHSSCGRSWYPSPCQGHDEPVACPAALRALRAAGTSRPLGGHRGCCCRGPRARLATPEALELRRQECGWPPRAGDTWEHGEVWEVGCAGPTEFRPTRAARA